MSKIALYEGSVPEGWEPYLGLDNPLETVTGKVRTTVKDTESNPEVVITHNRNKKVSYMVQKTEPGLNETQRREVQKMIEEALASLPSSE